MLMMSAIVSMAVLAAPAPGVFPVPESPLKAPRIRDVQLDAELTGESLAVGKASYRSRSFDKGAHRRFIVSLEGGASATAYKIIHQDQVIAIVTTDKSGSFEYVIEDFAETPGVTEKLPAMKVGDRVEISGLVAGHLH